MVVQERHYWTFALVITFLIVIFLGLQYSITPSGQAFYSCYAGDVNFDGVVDSYDLAAVDTCMQPARCTQFDVNNDGSANMLDHIELAKCEFPCFDYDVNLDGHKNRFDAYRIRDCFRKSPYCLQTDANDDMEINMKDRVLIEKNIGCS
ncbi:dockerin type I domain-containing protein [Nanoarchaeota archaeon]